MSAITIRDENGAELLTTDLPATGLARYLRAAASLRALVPIATVFGTPLAEHTATRTLGVTLDRDVPVGSAGELSLRGGSGAGIGLHAAGSRLFDDSDLQAGVTVADGTAYTSLTLDGRLDAGVSAPAGRIAFGFQAGTALRYTYCHPFDAARGLPLVREAIAAMCRAAVFPADVDDLARLPEGSYVSLAGEGEVSLRATAALDAATNILATPGLPLLGQVALTRGATASVGAAWTLSGDVELRVGRLDAGHVRLSYYRRRGRSLSVTAGASAGLAAPVRGREWLSLLMTAISPNPEADLLALADAGLGDDTIEAIQQAVAASVERSLAVGAQLEVSALRQHEALFAYDIDLDRLDASARAAVDAALHGRLDALDALASTPGTPVRAGVDAFRHLQQRGCRWRINLLGVLNVARFVDLVRDGRVLFDPATGALTAADAVSARRVRISSRPLESDTEKLHRVLFESLLVTAAYQASRTLGATVSLTAEQVYVEQHSRTKAHDLADHYRTLLALGLCDAAERDARLADAADIGVSTFTLENRFDAAACDTLFLDAAGAPRPMADYEAIGRRALLALLPADDPSRAFRRIALGDDTVWARARELGGAIAAALPDTIARDPGRLALVRGDVFTVVWWARAMHRAAAELVAMRTFLGARDAATLHGSDDFVRARARLSDALAAVVASSEARFDDPWDVLAMDAAAAGRGVLRAAIVATRLAVAYADDQPGGSVTPPVETTPASVTTSPAAAPSTPAAPATSAPRPPRAVAPVRDWTPAEQSVFTRHVVNLRAGRLSTDGSVTSTPEQVAAIFTTHIPAWARAERAAGRVPRVLFYAHGGLVDERGGLWPVLARRRFWAANHVYPVYFVWETGLRETLVDIVRGAVPGRAARAALSDAAIEQAARPGGRLVWGRMKTAAERAAAADGGATLVAAHAAQLWAAERGGLEFHAAGHSAGSIFHAWFLPRLLAQPAGGAPPLTLRTLHFLAPAVTGDTFKQQILPLVGAGGRIERLTMYTMTDQLEQDDATVHPYGKSLLYLVSQAFEDAVGTPILGLQRSLKADLALIRFFGLAGGAGNAEVIFSRTAAGAAADARSESITHGGFDNDIATMTSVVRRTIAAGPGQAVTDYFEDPVDGFSTGAGTPPAAQEQV